MNWRKNIFWGFIAILVAIIFSLPELLDRYSISPFINNDNYDFYFVIKDKWTGKTRLQLYNGGIIKTMDTEIEIK